MMVAIRVELFAIRKRRGDGTNQSLFRAAHPAKRDCSELCGRATVLGHRAFLGESVVYLVQNVELLIGMSVEWVKGHNTGGLAPAQCCRVTRPKPVVM